MTKMTKDLCFEKKFDLIGLAAPTPWLFTCIIMTIIFNIFSETALPIKAKFYMEPPLKGGQKVIRIVLVT